MSSEDVLETNNFLFRFEPKRDLFRFVAKLKENFGLFRCFGTVRNEPKQKIGILKQTATED